MGYDNSLANEKFYVPPVISSGINYRDYNSLRLVITLSQLNPLHFALVSPKTSCTHAILPVSYLFQAFLTLNFLYTGLFISPSGISELDCATTKTDTAERSISIGRESLQVFFVLGALTYFQVPSLGGSRDEKWRSQ